ncbi:glucoamylase family protein [Peristeroidobacter soli]|uniref:glucoamylase family protein n=1 Tax=Peristeroidobacter soli TaxID=2497877 RepID=UPI001C37AA2C|nr:glucoamylase family protein [Peristeroidobacter soli]
MVGAAGAAEQKPTKPKVPGVVVERSRVFDPERDGDPVINNLQRRTFRFFWDTTNKQNGLAPDRFPSPSFASTAAVGFALTAYVVGSERGFVSRSQARLRTLRTLRFLESMPQGPDETGMGGYKGFYYHFVHMHNGQRFGTSELSTVDTALLLGGVLLSQSYFDRDTSSEREIRELAEKIYSRVDWQWAQNRPPILSHGWRPESGFLRFDWRGYNEGMLMYILALGSPTHAIEPEAWTEWMRTYKDTYGKFNGQEFLSFGPQFGHQYSHVWIDFRGIMDEWNREKGYDYFENSRRASYAQREYARTNPMRWRGYDSEIWGLTACDGPADTVQIYNNEERGFFTYAARSTASIHILDDGTIAPTASVASIAFAPEIAIPAIRAFRARFGEHLYQKYGFLDSVNPSFTFSDVPLRHGRIIEGIGWIADDYLGIDQGPIVAMIENYRSGLIWSIMRTNPHIRRGLQRAGFTGGWLDVPAPSPPSS